VQRMSHSNIFSGLQMEDLTAWECGRPDLKSKNTGNSDEAYFMDLAVTGNCSSFEANSFGIQSAFNIDSGSDEVPGPPGHTHICRILWQIWHLQWLLGFEAAALSFRVP